MKNSKFYVNINKRFFTEKGVILWNKVPREVVESPSLELLRSTGQVPEHPPLADPAFRREDETDDFWKCFPTSTIQGFCEFSILVNCLKYVSAAIQQNCEVSIMSSKIMYVYY